jgi:peptidoglycan/LPS O-acetylase OafA/YrhL
MRTRNAALDGLRAVAVSYVVLFHYWQDRFPGGFVGVDIFFVLSGFLITETLIREISATGSLDLARFYVRRSARLLPPAIAVMIVVATLNAIALRETVWDNAVDVACVLLHLASWKRAYMERFGDSVYYNHMWSLSIEEWFYLFWPILILASVTRHQTKSVNIRAALTISILLMILAAGLRVLYLHLGFSATRIYHGLDTRIDELLCGCSLAFACRSRSFLEAASAAISRHRYVPFLCLMGLPVAAALCGIETTSISIIGYPTFYLLSAIVVFDARFNGQSMLSKALSAGIFNYIGLISYGIYLWHMPVLMLVETSPVADPTAQKVLSLVLSLGAAVMSYHTLEKHFRQFAHAPRNGESPPDEFGSSLAANNTPYSQVDLRSVPN